MTIWNYLGLFVSFCILGMVFYMIVQTETIREEIYELINKKREDVSTKRFKKSG